MLFNSVEFILAFLPVTLLGYFFFARWAGNELAMLWLVLASLFFYGWWDPWYMLIIIGSMIVNYLLGRRLYQTPSRSLLILGIAANLSLLGYFKYAGFLVWNLAWISGADLSIDAIVLPLAISFFTFQQIAYLVDSYKRITKEYRFHHYALFVTFFPQLIAGPIVHHKEMLPQFESSHAFRPKASHIAIGLSIFAIGLFKKTVIADTMAGYANPVFAAADEGQSVDLLLAWSGALAYSFQLYFDFSGYSDMALGLARMFGIILPLNFYSPYKAANISEFWRRWHMTLSRFLRDYVYIPMGGNRKGLGRRYLFLMTTMLLGGLWHGAGWNFVIWGGMHGAFLVVHQSWGLFCRSYGFLQLPKWLAWLVTMLAVVFSWVFFRATTLDGAWLMAQGMVGYQGILVPNAILARLGELGAWLQSLGIGAYHGSATQLVMAWLFNLLLIPAVVLLPNVQDIFHTHTPSLSRLHLERDSAFNPALRLNSALAWQPRTRWAAYCAVLLVAGVSTLGQVSDFLYFQF